MTDPPLTSACIALGSNIEPRTEHLAAAIQALRATPGVRVEAVSSWHETKPVRLPGSISASDAVEPAMYLNGACVLTTAISPRELLNVCLDIERARGRDRAKEGRWGSRTLDLDLLLYGDSVIVQPGLILPHPRMLERLFVLEPLAEVASDWLVPGTNQAVRAHLDTLRKKSNFK